MNDIGTGDIAALVGCKGVQSGDTLIDEDDKEEIILEGVSMPKPVFFCSIEANESRNS